jgi:glycosyltransferase involved in cell wall biosynthesis
MKLSIVIPAYNEEKRIGKTLEEYGKFFEELRKKKMLEYEILVVINNTKDKTEEIVREKIKVNKNIRYLNFIKGGKGFAITEGFKDALKRDNDIIGFVDADMATSSEAFYDLVKNIGNSGGAIANRYSKHAKINISLKRKIISRVFNFLVRIIFIMPYRDTQCGAKIFRRKVLEKVMPSLGMTAWAFDLDLLYQCKKSGIKLNQIATVWQDKGDSKMNLKRDSIKMLMAAFQLRILNSPISHFWKVLGPIAGILWRIVK